MEEKNVKELFLDAGLEKAPEGLNRNIMQAIESLPEKKVSYEPVIGKKAWIMIAAAIAALVFFALTSDAGTSVVNVNIPSIDLSFPQAFLEVFSGRWMLIPAFLFILMIVDGLLRRRQLSSL